MSAPTSLPVNAVPFLAAAITDLVGTPVAGSMAFIRCLPAVAARQLVTDPRFVVTGWRVAVVAGHADTEAHTITADIAVELREDKREAVLLFVDPETAGAGMDGIYSAAREISEGELFAVARERARSAIPHGGRVFAQRALSKARRIARLQGTSPWREFRYLCCASKGLEDIGASLPEIGLWPIAIDDKPDEIDLEKSATLVERLLPRQGSRDSAEARVEAIKLSSQDIAVERALAAFLREHENLPRAEALLRISSHEEFWLNRMQPGLFDAQTLLNIRWVNWRGKSGRPAAWSGLGADDDNRLNLRLSQDDSPDSRVRLEVRWDSEPTSLAKGAVDYSVEIRAGTDVLAEKLVSHSPKGPQKCVFTQDDFGELEEDSRFEAEVVITALVGDGMSLEDGGESPYRAISEDFILCFGDSIHATRASAGNVYATLALAAIHVAPDAETFDRLANDPANKHAFSLDSKGYVTCRNDGKSARVLCPNLLLDLAQDWISKGGVPGRWRQRVRSDGSRVGDAQFIPVAVDGESTGTRFSQASRAFSTWLAQSQGPLGVLYSDRKQITDYVNSAAAWWETSVPESTLVHTLEVVGEGGRQVGLIVLPTHPLRVAWQQAFDMLARHHRYEAGATATKVTRLLSSLTGAHYPAVLPGIRAGDAFVFADSLGFHAVAMTSIGDEEPKATLSLLSRLLVGADLGAEEIMAPSVGKSAAELVGMETGRYLTLHPEVHRVRVHAVRPGDAMPVARALGTALRVVEANSSDGFGDHVEHDVHGKRAFALELFPAAGRKELAGRFLATTAERRRSGAGAVPEEDRWLLESVTRPGGVTLPRLSWTRRGSEVPQTPAHLAIAFDIFSCEVALLPAASLPSGGLEVHGLSLASERLFRSLPEPRWESFVSPNVEGEKHPAGRGLSERLVKVHHAILRDASKKFGGGTEDWPVIVTRVSPDRAEMLAQLHRLCDWVITIDRHAGVEYFDSPRDLPLQYESFLIDCVPERDDLGFLQLITTTSSLDEVFRLLDVALGEMGLSTSPRNCGYLLDALKAVSGRLALRLSQSGTVAQEMVAIALTYRQCAAAQDSLGPWLSLSEGFFVPLDDVPELFRPVGDRRVREEGGKRADLLYVSCGRRGGLRFSFVEVKFRRYLKTARAPDLIEAIDAQLTASTSRWEQLFGEVSGPLERTVQRGRLARVLRFYAKKGCRHALSNEASERIDKELLKLSREGSEYPLPTLLDQDRPKVGFVFCPEYGGPPNDIGGDIWLFGPDALPEDRARAPDAPSSDPALDNVLSVGPSPVRHPHVPSRSNQPEERPGEAVAMLDLGKREGSDEDVNWSVSVQGNPHMLMVGLPGMGKTTCVLNLCEQLMAADIAPIVFSYHEDIDLRLQSSLDGNIQTVSYAGLGFNPLEVTGQSPLAYMDNVSMLRDVFAAVFPDLGDIQLGRLREAIKQSYLDKGWAPGVRGKQPEFSSFYAILNADPKPDKGLMTRLAELADYGFFASASGSPSLLESNSAALVQVHATQNEVMQRAFAVFVLHNLYQSMFRRGVQTRITHAIVFDEAHRAAKLRLIPTMAKECRKFGISLIVASQEAKDFDQSMFTAIANYLTLRVSESDAKIMAKIMAPSAKVSLYSDRIKQTPKFKAWFYAEGMRQPVLVGLKSEI